MLNAHANFVNAMAKATKIYRVFRPINTPILEFTDFMEKQITHH